MASTENVDLQPYRGERNILIGRPLSSPRRPKSIKVVPGLFGCVYVYTRCARITDHFIVVNCEANPGGTAVPRPFFRVGFRQIGEIRKRYYDEFDIYSAPMHANTRRSLRNSILKWFFFEPFRKRIDFEDVPLQARRAIYVEAIKHISSASEVCIGKPDSTQVRL